MILQEIHWEVKLRYNKLDSDHKKDLSPAEIDAVVNNAINYFVECCYSGNNYKKYKLGFEVIQQRTDMLSNLVVRRPRQPILTHFNVENNVYEYKISQLAYPYIYYLRSNVQTECGLAEVRIEQHDDLNLVLKDPYRKPSKKWRRLVGSFNEASDGDGDSLYVYTDGEFASVQGLHMEYLRAPKKVFFGGYDSIEYEVCVLNGGTEEECAAIYNTASSPTVECDISSHYHSFIVDIAVQELARIMEDNNRLAAMKDKVDTLF